MSTISHAGPPCLASDDDKHVPVRCTRDRGHEGDHAADDGEVIVATWPANGARFAPEVVDWARDVLTSGVSGPHQDESAPTDETTSTGASPTPSEARSKTMSSITETRSETHWTDIIGLQIKAEMKARGWTQARVARELGIPLSSFSRRLNGRGKIYVAEILGIGELIGVSAAGLIQRAELLDDAASA